MAFSDEDAGCAAPRIETARLQLRPPRPDDVDWIERLLGDEEVARFTARIPHPYPPGEAAAYLASMGAPDEPSFVIQRRENGKPIGMIGFKVKDRQAVAGYWIGRAFWNKGFGTEAVAAVADHAFSRFDISCIKASIVPENGASIRTLERNGFMPSGTGEIDAPARGGKMQVEWRRLDRGEWQRRRLERAVPLLLVVAVALIDADGRVLLAQRPPGKSMAGLWEFPGGKLHDGESPEEALVRELKEELGIDTSESCLAPIAFASHRYETFHLLMPLYVCRVWKGTPHPHEGQTLAWARPQKLADYPMPPADLPLIPVLQDLL
jgi:8-oxo-dGTP diphosphatase